MAEKKRNERTERIITDPTLILRGEGGNILFPIAMIHPLFLESDECKELLCRSQMKKTELKKIVTYRKVLPSGNTGTDGVTELWAQYKGKTTLSEKYVLHSFPVLYQKEYPRDADPETLKIAYVRVLNRSNRLRLLLSMEIPEAIRQTEKALLQESLCSLVKELGKNEKKGGLPIDK